MDNVDSFDVWSLWWQAAYIGVDDSSAIGLEPDIDFGLISEYSTQSSSPSYSEEEDFNKGNRGPETASAKGISRSTSKSKPRQTPYTDTQLMRRREQNRSSQKAYRERKDRRIKELEAQVASAEQATKELSSAYEELKLEFQTLQKNQSQQDVVIAGPIADHNCLPTETIGPEDLHTIAEGDSLLWNPSSADIQTQWTSIDGDIPIGPVDIPIYTTRSWPELTKANDGVWGCRQSVVKR